MPCGGEGGGRPSLLFKLWSGADVCTAVLWNYGAPIDSEWEFKHQAAGSEMTQRPTTSPRPDTASDPTVTAWWWTKGVKLHAAEKDDNLGPMTHTHTHFRLYSHRNPSRPSPSRLKWSRGTFVTVYTGRSFSTKIVSRNVHGWTDVIDQNTKWHQRLAND